MKNDTRNHVRDMRYSSCITAITAVAAVFSMHAVAAGEYAGKPYEGDDVYADTWAATDAAGRTQPDLAQAGPVKPGRYVGIFYWTWHVPNAGGPNDNTATPPPSNGRSMARPIIGANLNSATTV
jgi:hypothetical protein